MSFINVRPQVATIDKAHVATGHAPVIVSDVLHREYDEVGLLVDAEWSIARRFGHERGGLEFEVGYVPTVLNSWELQARARLELIDQSRFSGRDTVHVLEGVDSQFSATGI